MLHTYIEGHRGQECQLMEGSHGQHNREDGNQDIQRHRGHTQTTRCGGLRNAITKRNGCRNMGHGNGKLTSSSWTSSCTTRAALWRYLISYGTRADTYLY